MLLRCGELSNARGDLLQWWRDRGEGRGLIEAVRGLGEMEEDLERQLLKRVGRIWKAFEDGRERRRR